MSPNFRIIIHQHNYEFVFLNFSVTTTIVSSTMKVATTRGSMRREKEEGKKKKDKKRGEKGHQKSFLINIFMLADLEWYYTAKVYTLYKLVKEFLFVLVLYWSDSRYFNGNKISAPRNLDACSHHLRSITHIIDSKKKRARTQFKKPPPSPQLEH